MLKKILAITIALKSLLISFSVRTSDVQYKMIYLAISSLSGRNMVWYDIEIFLSFFFFLTSDVHDILYTSGVGGGGYR